MCPEELIYSKEHEWVRIKDDTSRRWDYRLRPGSAR